MIGVHLHGTNYFSLKGDCLGDRTRSQISVHPKGYAIRVSLERRNLEEFENLRRDEVIPKLKEILENHRVDEDIHEPEINKYIAHLQAFANRHYPEEKKTKHWAICQYYEPFTMGGNVWQWRRYQVEAEEIDLNQGFKGFVHYNKYNKKHSVHEVSTGGWLGNGSTKDEAIAQANSNIDETPDLKEQIAAFGDTSHYKVVDAAEAMKRIAKQEGITN